MDTTENEVDQPIDPKTQAALDALSAETLENSAFVTALNNDTKEKMQEITHAVDTAVEEIERSMQEMDKADTEAGDQLDLLMMQTAEDLASE